MDSNGGASTDRPQDVLRKHLPSTFRGRVWDALLEALATGDAYVRDTIQSAFDQLFVTSASGIYLTRRAADRGVAKPVNIGISDALFRKLSIATSTNKLTEQALLDILEIYYGVDAIRAFVDSVAGPFQLSDGDTLRVSLDGAAAIEIVLTTEDFADISAASVTEVAIALSRAFRLRGLFAYAIRHVDVDTGEERIRIYSGSPGLLSSITVAGGLAQNALQFPTILDVDTAGATLAITLPTPGTTLYAVTSTDPILIDVNVGDVVNITAPTVQATNRGSFVVTAVNVVWSGSAWAQYFETTNDGAAQGGPLALADGELMFFRPTKASNNRSNGRTVIVGQSEDDRVTIRLPATTAAVIRSEHSGAYLHTNPDIVAEASMVGADGSWVIPTATAHGLVAGQQVIVDGVYPTLVAPATVAGTNASSGLPGTAATAQTTLWTPIRAPDGLVAVSDVSVTALTTGDLMLVGGSPGTSRTSDQTSRWRRTASAPLTSGAARGRNETKYNWISTAVCPDKVAKHRSTALSGILKGRLLTVGGQIDVSPYVTIPTPTLYWTMDSADIVDDGGGEYHFAGFGSNPQGAGFSYPGNGAGVTNPTVGVAGSIAGKTAVQFSGTKQWLRIAGSACNVLTQDMTVFAHTKSIGGGQVLAFNTALASPNYQGISSYVAGDEAFAFLQGTGALSDFGTLTPGTSLLDNAWHDVGWVYDRNGGSPAATGYADGVVGSSPVTLTANTSMSLNNTPSDGFIAARFVASDLYFAQVQAETAVWFQVLDADQLDTLHRLRVDGVTIKQYLAGDFPEVLGASDGVLLYDSSTNTWSPVANGTLVARYNHAQVRVADVNGDDVVYIIGGQTGDTSATGSIQRFTSANGGTIANFITETQPRFNSAAVCLDAGIWITAGGAYFDTGVPAPKTDCYAYNHQTAAQIPTGHLAVARMDLAMVALSPTRALAIGGYGRVLSSEVTDRVVSECEVWDLSTGRWTPAGRLRFARRSPQAFMVDSKVYVWGGKDAGGNAVPYVEVYDIATGKWTLAPATANIDLHTGSGADLGSLGLGLSFGGLASGTRTAGAFLFAPGADAMSRASASGVHRIASAPTTTSLQLDLPSGPTMLLAAGTAVSMAAELGSQDGPYVWDPTGGAAITDKTAISSTDLFAGQHYAEITVDDATVFPDEPGWLAFSYGYEGAVYPVKYLGLDSATTLRMNFGFVMPRDIPAGSQVTLLSQKGPFVSEHPEDVGSFYVTASNAGRVQAERSVRESLAAGFDHQINVVYPSDIGLGNAGGPIVGDKISDKISVWGGDDLDAELAVARGDNG